MGPTKVATSGNGSCGGGHERNNKWYRDDGRVTIRSTSML